LVLTGIFRIIEGLVASGCDAVGLVCAEIPLLVPPGASPPLVLDSTRLLARAAFGAAIGHRALPAWRGTLWWADDAGRPL
jgi:aspartate/glutamate racemase